MIALSRHSSSPCHGGYSRLGLVVLCLATLVLSACSDQLDDLRKYTDEVKARPGGHIPPLPEPKPFIPFLYKADNTRDPFAALAAAQKIGTGGSGLSTSTINPDTTRRKETLESYALADLHMVGSLAKDGTTWAIIKTPDGMVYRVSKNNYMGQNHGRIVKITENKVELLEVVPDDLGGWREQPASLSLEE